MKKTLLIFGRPETNPSGRPSPGTAPTLLKPA